MVNCRNKLAFSILFGICVLLLSFLLRGYASVDDYQVALITNGVYSSDSYCLFIHPILCWCVRLLHSVFPNIDFYLLFIRLAHCFTLAVLVYYLPLKGLPNPVRPFLLFLLCFSAVNMNYTVLTAFITGCGMCLFFLDPEEITNQRYILSVIIISVGCLLRTQVVFLSLPFFALELFFYLITGRNGKAIDPKYKRHAIVLVAAVTVALITAVSVKLFVPAYREGAEYNEARTVLVDYPMQSYENVSSDLAGISENDYYSLRGLFLADTDRIDTKYMETIGSAGSVKESVSFRNISKAFSQFISCVKAEVYTATTVAMSILLLLCSMFCITCPMEKAKCFLAFSGSVLICLYFALKGRIVDRLIISVFTFSIFISISSITGSLNSIRNRGRIKQIMAVILSFLIFCLNIYIGLCRYWAVRYHHSMKPVCEEQIDKAWSADDDTLYIWNVFDFDNHVMNPYMEAEQLFDGSVLDHHVVFGEWTYGQVYMNDYLRKIGIPNPAKALLERPDTFYAGFDKDMVETYLREHFDADCHATDTGRTMYGVPVWSFQK